MLTKPMPETMAVVPAFLRTGHVRGLSGSTAQSTTALEDWSTFPSGRPSSSLGDETASGSAIFEIQAFATEWKLVDRHVAESTLTYTGLFEARTL